MPLYEVTNVFYPRKASEFSVLVSREIRDVQVIEAPDRDTAMRVSFVDLMPLYGPMEGGRFVYSDDVAVREQVGGEWVEVPTDED